MYRLATKSTENKKTMLSQGPRDAAVNFIMSRKLQRHCAVSLRYHSFRVKARYTLPVRTGRLSGSFERVVCIGLK